MTQPPHSAADPATDPASPEDENGWLWFINDVVLDWATRAIALGGILLAIGIGASAEGARRFAVAPAILLACAAFVPVAKHWPPRRQWAAVLVIVVLLVVTGFVGLSG